MKFTVDEREYLEDMRALTTDSNGAEVYAGLTAQESAEYYELTRLEKRSGRSFEDKERLLALNEKHELVRIAMVNAVTAASNDKSPRH